ncbi:hypothetical protein D621_16495 [beta proteobacterium AAP51]|nr:hypothetical protein D621_16495 [beta proteobacterium AAP51]
MRRRLPFATAAAALALVLDAGAVSLAPTSQAAVLGQPLDFAVQVRLQPGETLEASCVSAEVTVGDRRVPPALVRTQLAMTGNDSARIRVLTEPAIDEPVVGVVLSAGCAAARYTRRYVVLADPPVDTFLPSALAAAPLVPPQALAPASAPGAAGPAAAPMQNAGATTTPAPGAGSLGAEAAAAPRPTAAPTPSRARTETPEARQAREARQRARAEARAEARNAARAAARDEERRAAAARQAEAGGSTPRLRLEAVAPVPEAAAVGVEQAMQAVAEAALAARAAASAASAASARIATLESTVAELRTEAGAERAQAADLRARLARAEQSGRWTTPLLALVLLLTSLAAWLAWRLNAADRARQRGWQVPQGVEGAAARGPQTSLPPALGERASELTPSRLPTAPIPFVNSEIKLPTVASARARPAWPAPVILPPDTEPPPAMMATQPLPRRESENPMLRTEPLPSQGVFSEGAPRDVSIEELIDLEQQAEFFVVLGQDDAAIDLLLEHLRHTGGGSPLPYLKLLEIYRRRSMRADYERLRERFNLRFNAYAPEWEADLLAGRGLETYAGVIPRLQQVWPRPLDAMAELEALLFRKSRGDLFDLPAYREVLFLYALARDLLDRESADSGQVDLLLPMADGGEFSSTSPAPYLALERDAGRVQERPTAPLDFDISVGVDSETGARSTSLFGPLDEPAVPRARR